MSFKLKSIPAISLLALSAIILPLAISGQEAIQKADTPEERIVQHLQQAIKAREEAYAYLAEAWKGQPQGKRFVLTLNDGLLLMPLTLELYTIGERIVEAFATCRTFHKSKNPVDCSALRIAPERIRGTIEVQLISDGWVPEPDKQLRLKFDLDVALEHGKAVGQHHTHANPELNVQRAMLQGEAERAGRKIATRGRAWTKFVEQIALTDNVTGTFTNIKLEVPVPPQVENLQFPQNTRDIAARFAWAIEMERLVERCYRDVRACLHSAVTYKPFDAVDAELPFIAVVRSNEVVNEMAALESIANRVAMLVQALRPIHEYPTEENILKGEVLSPDPLFTGMFLNGTLEQSKQGHHRLAKVKTDGLDEWRRLAQWRTSGPFYFSGAPEHALPLPEFFEASDGTFAAAERFVSQLIYGYGGPKGTRGGTQKGFAFSGLSGPKVHAPWHTKNYIPLTIMYGNAEIDSEIAQRVWIALDVVDYGALWVNDRLIWNGGTQYRGTCVFPIELKQGINRLLVRCMNDTAATGFEMRVCVNGAPRKLDQAQSKNSFELLPLEPTTVGWRGDGTGIFKSNEPVTAWDIEKGINVRWRVPLERWSHATPIVIGDKLFVNAEPHTLICMNKDTGEILWQRDANILELMEDDAERKQALADYERELKAGALEITEDEQKLREKLEQINDRLRENENDKELLAQAEGISREISQFELQRRGLQYWANKMGAKYVNFKGGGRLWGSVTGMTMGTPVSDGRHIWVKYGSGVAACFDLDGNRKWMTRTYFENDSVANVPSPVLAGDTLVLIGASSEHWSKKRSNKGGNCWVLGLSATTGEIRWNHGPIPNGGHGGPVTPVAVRMQDELGKTDRFVITGEGYVLRASDGIPILDTFPARSAYASPYVLNNAVHFTHSGIAGVEMRLRSDGQIGARRIYKGMGPVGLGGCVYHNGLVYSFTGGNRVPPSLSVFDAVTGKLVTQLKEFTPRVEGNDWCPPVVAGRYLYCWGKQWAFVFEAGRVPRLIAENRVEPMHASPVIHENRIYLRTSKAVMCLERIGGEGLAYESNVQAQVLMEPYLAGANKLRFAKMRPKVTVLSPLPEGTLSHLPAMVFRSDEPLRNWVSFGHFSAKETPLETYGGIERFVPSADLRLEYAGKSYSLKPLDHSIATSSGIDLDLLTGVTRGNQAFLFANLRVSSPSFLQATQKLSGVTLYLGGVALETEKVYRVTRGDYLIAAHVALGRNNPVNQRTIADLKITEVPDPDEALTHFVERARRERSMLERITTIAPGSEYAKQAINLLGLIE